LNKTFSIRALWLEYWIDDRRRKLDNEVTPSLSRHLQSGRTPLYIAARGSFTAIVDMIIKTARLDYPIPVGTAA
jgi:hypothetical protein